MYSRRPYFQFILNPPIQERTEVVTFSLGQISPFEITLSPNCHKSFNYSKLVSESLFMHSSPGAQIPPNARTNGQFFIVMLLVLWSATGLC